MWVLSRTRFLNFAVTPHNSRGAEEANHHDEQDKQKSAKDSENPTSRISAEADAARHREESLQGEKMKKSRSQQTEKTQGEKRERVKGCKHCCLDFGHFFAFKFSYSNLSFKKVLEPFKMAVYFCEETSIKGIAKI